MRPHRCHVCAQLADPEQTSAHFAGVWRFCTTCGTAFHAPENLTAIRAAGNSLAQWRAIEAWALSRRLSLNPPCDSTPAPTSDASSSPSSPSDGPAGGAA